MFEFQDFIKIVLAAMIAFIAFIVISLMADDLKKTIDTTLKKWNEEETPKSKRPPFPLHYEKFQKGEKVYIYEPTYLLAENEQSSYKSLLPSNSIIPGIVIETPLGTGNIFDYMTTSYILELEDGTYRRVIRKEIYKRDWSTTREKFNEMADNEPVNTEDE